MSGQHGLSSSSIRCRVVSAYQSSNPEPLVVQADELFRVSEKVSPWNDNPAWLWIWCTDQRGKSAWVPTTAIKMSDDGRSGTVQQPYDATELTVNVGDELQIEQEESGWYWCVDPQGQWGWVPTENVELLATS